MHKSVILVVGLKQYNGEQRSQVIHVRLQPYIWFVCSSPLMLSLVWFSSPWVHRSLIPHLTSLCELWEVTMQCAQPRKLSGASLWAANSLKGKSRSFTWQSTGWSLLARNPTTSQVINQSFTVGVGWQRAFSKVCITQERAQFYSAHGGLARLRKDRCCRSVLPASILTVRMYSGKWHWFKCLDRYNQKETINDVINPTGVFQSKAPRSCCLHSCDFLSAQDRMT